jgi:hypothetical protein
MRLDKLLNDNLKDRYEYDYTVLTNAELETLIDLCQKMDGPDAEDYREKTVEELQEIVETAPDHSASWLEGDTDRLTYPEQRELKRLHDKALVNIHRN